MNGDKISKSIIDLLEMDQNYCHEKTLSYDFYPSGVNPLTTTKKKKLNFKFDQWGLSIYLFLSLGNTIYMNPTTFNVMMPRIASKRMNLETAEDLGL